MKFRTRIQLLQKKYRLIREDNEAIDQIWNKKEIPLEGKIDICINNNYLDKLKEVSQEEIEALLEKVSSSRDNRDLNAYYQILNILYVKNDYSLIPKFNQSIRLLNNVTNQNYKPSLLFSLNYFQYMYNDEELHTNSMYLYGLSLVKKMIINAQSSFIEAVENDINIRENFFKVIENREAVESIAAYINDNQILLDFFCKEHPEWFLHRVYNIKNYDAITNYNMMINRNIIMCFNYDLKPLVAYYYSSVDYSKQEEDVSTLLDSLFDLDAEENKYITNKMLTAAINNRYVELLLKNRLQKPDFIKKLIELEKKYLRVKDKYRDNFMPFYLRYSNSPLIDELLAIDLDKFSNSEKEELITKLNVLAKKPRLKVLDNVDTLISNRVSDLEKKGYEVSENTAASSFKGNPQSSSEKYVFVYPFEAIKVDSTGYITGEHSFVNCNHVPMLKLLNKNNIELAKGADEWTIIRRMISGGDIVVLTEGSNCLIFMPKIENMTLEQIQAFKDFISEKGNAEAKYNYGFVLKNGTVDEVDDISKNDILEILENIYIQKSEQQSTTMK